MVCLGNICRSPVAEAALRHAAEQAGIPLEVDSAGTAAYHLGKPADPRMHAAATAAGLTLTSIARQVTAIDFDRFDLIVAMDADNLNELRSAAPTPASREKVVLLRDYTDTPGRDVPDPYYGGPEGFDEVVQIVTAGAAGLLAALQSGG